MRYQTDALTHFSDAFARAQSRIAQALESEVFGANVGVQGDTTVAQAEGLADLLALGPETLLLDIGAFQGWPSLRLVERTGCRAVLMDLPVNALGKAARRAGERGLYGRCRFVQAAAPRLPFRPRVFDAVVHTDTL